MDLFLFLAETNSSWQFLMIWTNYLLYTFRGPFLFFQLHINSKFYGNW